MQECFLASNDKNFVTTSEQEEKQLGADVLSCAAEGETVVQAGRAWIWALAKQGGECKNSAFPSWNLIGSVLFWPQENNFGFSISDLLSFG